ncbi:hypothetical protein FSOLCH5_012242 [Fusarium solani]|jgi:hypothetical protein|uniref:Uncharacterized protein n=1 Tax=Fusarium solani TaxID=169388 RepID=A0A9P9GYG9_FUSSL|nr:uncharacterized protein B0J15DRAFT_551985 [Fusarium solani]KAH7246999.1 hypothetical protein B0J15DRAFT_551985 [Fusarium solani]KAJ3457668.1 hypothetical protein MRS44_014809 [Fusarium solani]KAJ4219377.1 hypothetical protein NW759_007766 [Fusarium solani]
MISHTIILPILLGAANAASIPNIFKRDLTAQLTVGSSLIPLSTGDGAKIVGDALRQVCSQFGCDSGTTVNNGPFIAQFEDFGDKLECTWSVTGSGNYDSLDERDYMINVLTTSLTTTADVSSIKVSIEDNPLCTSQGQPSCETQVLPVTKGVNFQQVVLNKDDGSNTAQLDYRLSVECKGSSDFDCPAVISGALKDVLGGIPAVGGIIAGAFSLACAA